jgi:hypothetical protein
MVIRAMLEAVKLTGGRWRRLNGHQGDGGGG